MRAVLALPLLVILAGLGALAMLVPALQALVTADYAAARAFFYHGLLLLALCALVGIATSNYAPRNSARSHLMALVATFVILPAMLALPLRPLLPGTPFLDLYFEMVSSLTTTGASVFDAPLAISDTVHLWRAEVAWIGGFLMWLSAIAIMAPLNLGGFEVFATLQGGTAAQGMGRIAVADASARLVRHALRLAPVYLAITLALWVALLLAGDRSLVALCHAMSTISTSGISPVGGIRYGEAGIWGEVAIFVFLIFAVSRRTFAFDLRREALVRLREDRELRMALACVTILPLVLFLRHWIAAFESNQQESLGQALHSLWGAVFTVLSFLTTAGFESADWADARDWSGLATPGLILMGLAMVGGGVATTAGGVKLLRVYALYKHGIREMQKLVHPSSIGGAGIYARRIRRQGAYIAWIFFMLFVLSVGVVMTALSLVGNDFEASLILAVAALSTTGPVAAVAGEGALSYGALTDAAKLILAAAMVLGRLETLALIALLNPDTWR
jgi:trk system potassium uptake protein TrkH